MSDLISRQAAIEALWKISHERDSVYYTSAIYTAVDAIEALPSVQPEPLTLRVNHELTKEEYDKLMHDIKDAPIVLFPSAQPQWIPCSERLPDMWDERYLVSLAWGGIGVMEFKSTGFHNYGSFAPVPIESVTAWMPLPEPWKGEQP